MVYTLAAQLITSCPAGPSLPVKASTPLLFPSGLPIGQAAAGSEVSLTYTKSSSSMAGPVSAAVYNGLGATLVPFTNGKLTLPKVSLSLPFTSTHADYPRKSRASPTSSSPTPPTSPR
jgi:hypothetical protein